MCAESRCAVMFQFLTLDRVCPDLKQVMIYESGLPGL
jgi:hypothetical protein